MALDGGEPKSHARYAYETRVVASDSMASMRNQIQKQKKKIEELERQLCYHRKREQASKEYNIAIAIPQERKQTTPTVISDGSTSIDKGGISQRSFELSRVYECSKENGREFPGTSNKKQETHSQRHSLTRARIISELDTFHYEGAGNESKDDVIALEEDVRYSELELQGLRNKSGSQARVTRVTTEEVQHLNTEKGLEEHIGIPQEENQSTPTVMSDDSTCFDKDGVSQLSPAYKFNREKSHEFLGTSNEKEETHSQRHLLTTASIISVRKLIAFLYEETDNENKSDVVVSKEDLRHLDSELQDLRNISGSQARVTRFTTEEVQHLITGLMQTFMERLVQRFSLFNKHLFLCTNAAKHAPQLHVVSDTTELQEVVHVDTKEHCYIAEIIVRFEEVSERRAKEIAALREANDQKDREIKRLTALCKQRGKDLNEMEEWITDFQLMMDEYERRITQQESTLAKLNETILNLATTLIFVAFSNHWLYSIPPKLP